MDRDQDRERGSEIGGTGEDLSVYRNITLERAVAEAGYRFCWGRVCNIR